MTARMLLVHGAFHGAWCWDRLVPELRSRGIEVEAVDLPFSGPEADREAVSTAIERLGRDGDPVVVVGHSLGGSVISAAAGGASHLVYLAALLHGPDQVPDIGQTPGMAALRLGEVEASVDPDMATIAFYHRCSADDAAWATARLRPMPVTCLMAPLPEQPAWRRVPSTYILCTDDQIVSPTAQRAMSALAGETIEMDSDHSPFLSSPDALAEVLAGVAAAVTSPKP